MIYNFSGLTTYNCCTRIVLMIRIDNLKLQVI